MFVEESRERKLERWEGRNKSGTM